MVVLKYGQVLNTSLEGASKDISTGQHFSPSYTVAFQRLDTQAWTHPQMSAVEATKSMVLHCKDQDKGSSAHSSAQEHQFQISYLGGLCTHASLLFPMQVHITAKSNSPEISSRLGSFHQSYLKSSANAACVTLPSEHRARHQTRLALIYEAENVPGASVPGTQYPRLEPHASVPPCDPLNPLPFACPSYLVPTSFWF